MTHIGASSLHRRLQLAGLVVMLAGSSAPARADVAVFAGVLGNGGARSVVGVAVGRAPSMVGFEIEYAGTVGNATATEASGGGVHGSVIIQTRPDSRRVQLYAIGGFGMWGEKYQDGRGTGEIAAANLGGGVKLLLRGKFKLRLDYRLFILGDAPDAGPGVEVQRRRHRVAAGLSFTF